VNDLLSCSLGFQQYFSIVDGDIDRSLAPPTPAGRLFQLPVYHVENFLLDDGLILQTIKDMMGSRCPYTSPADIETELRRLALADAHLKPFARTLLDARVACVAKEAWDAVFQRKAFSAPNQSFAVIEDEARTAISQAITDGTWRSKCKGRELLKAMAAENGLNYEHFRNCIIAKLSAPPLALKTIMDQILQP
jgi:hypothetical protein